MASWTSAFTAVVFCCTCASRTHVSTPKCNPCPRGVSLSSGQCQGSGQWVHRERGKFPKHPRSNALLSSLFATCSSAGISVIALSAASMRFSKRAALTKGTTGYQRKKKNLWVMQKEKSDSVSSHGLCVLFQSKVTVHKAALISQQG